MSRSSVDSELVNMVKYLFWKIQNWDARMNTLEEIRTLPVSYRATITDDFLDEYGHMNVRWYATLWGHGARGFMNSLGVDSHEDIRFDIGYWVLRQVMDYNAEVLSGDTISIHGRMIERSEKCMHNMYWMLNETRESVAGSSEVVVGHADLKARRLMSFPPDIGERFDTAVAEWDSMDWLPELSGAIALAASKR